MIIYTDLVTLLFDGGGKGHLLIPYYLTFLSFFLSFYRIFDTSIGVKYFYPCYENMTPSHGRAKAGRPARTYIQLLCAYTGCDSEDLLEAMDDREEIQLRP